MTSEGLLLSRCYHYHISNILSVVISARNMQFSIEVDICFFNLSLKFPHMLQYHNSFESLNTTNDPFFNFLLQGIKPYKNIFYANFTIICYANALNFTINFAHIFGMSPLSKLMIKGEREGGGGDNPCTDFYKPLDIECTTTSRFLRFL